MIKFLMALAVVVLGVMGQVCIKIGALQLGPVSLKTNSIWEIAIKLISIPYIPGGFILWALGAFLWLGVLTRVELSYAYPIFSLSFVLIALVSWLLFKENITVWRIAGILIICFGIAVMYRS
jgi:drug/metabolite transporter (DMT)-like permease